MKTGIALLGALWHIAISSFPLAAYVPLQQQHRRKPATTPSKPSVQWCRGRFSRSFSSGSWRLAWQTQQWLFSMAVPMSVEQHPRNGQEILPSCFLTSCMTVIPNCFQASPSLGSKGALCVAMFILSKEQDWSSLGSSYSPDRNLSWSRVNSAG